MGVAIHLDGNAVLLSTGISVIFMCLNCCFPTIIDVFNDKFLEIL